MPKQWGWTHGPGRMTERGCFHGRMPRREPSSLPGALALLLALGVVLVLADGSGGAESSSPAPTAAEDSGLDSRELARLAAERTPAVARRVEAVRGLRFDRIPRPRLADTDYLRRLSERQLSRPRAAGDLRADEASLRLLGMIEPEAEIADIASDYTALAAAFYEPRAKRLFVVSDAVPAGPPLVEFVLAHELTHALEDQRFGLPQGGGGSDEQALAESALVEGTATALMSDYAAAHLNAVELASAAAGIVEPQAELPAFLEAQSSFSYLRGREFVEYLRDSAKGWTLVDRAFTEEPPQTSEQILHPAKYLLGERALPVDPLRSPGPGWRELDDDLIGEFLTSQLLQVAEGVVPSAAAEGWGGDRYQLWERRGAGACEDACRSTHALALGWRWDTSRDLDEFRDALVEYVASGLSGDRRGSGSWELDGGWAQVRVSGGVVRLGLGPTAAVARRLAG